MSTALHPLHFAEAYDTPIPAPPLTRAELATRLADREAELLAAREQIAALEAASEDAGEDLSRLDGRVDDLERRNNDLAVALLARAALLDHARREARKWCALADARKKAHEIVVDRVQELVEELEIYKLAVTRAGLADLVRQGRGGEC